MLESWYYKNAIHVQQDSCRRMENGAILNSLVPGRDVPNISNLQLLVPKIDIEFPVICISGNVTGTR